MRRWGGWPRAFLRTYWQANEAAWRVVIVNTQPPFDFLACAKCRVMFCAPEVAAGPDESPSRFREGR